MRCLSSGSGEFAVAAPLQVLAQHAAASRTGEFVFADGAVEFHVYLQRGRLAWATDSAHPFAFLLHLKEHRQLDDHSLREVVEACRAERRALGEALVAWNLASLEDVRAALRHQVQVTVEHLAQVAPAGSLFLERPRFLNYDERLTFGLDEVLGALEPAPKAGPAAAEPPPVRVAGAGEPLAGVVHAAAARAANVAVFLAERQTEDAPPGAGGLRATPQLARWLSTATSDFVALRTDGRSLLGVRTREAGPTVFASLDDTAHYGQTLAALRATGWRPPEYHRTRELPEPEAWGAGDGRGLESMLDYDRGLLAVVVADADGQVVAGVGRSTLPPAAVQEGLTRWREPFALLDGLAAGQGQFVLGEGDAWVFAAPLGRDGRLVCLLTHRRGPQGLGWAALNSVLRLLGATTRGGA